MLVRLVMPRYTLYGAFVFSEARKIFERMAVVRARRIERDSEALRLVKAELPERGPYL